MISPYSTRQISQFAALAILSATLFTMAPAIADENKKSEPAIISVSAEGTADIAPDMAVITLSVLQEAETARQALDANTQAMAKVLAAMKTAGVAEKDLQTSNFNIQPRWVYPKQNDSETNQPRIVAYQVTNGLSVRVRDLTKLGEILDTSVTLGVNQGGQIQFTNDDPSEVISSARKNAVKNALKKAQEMTEAAGVKLGRITQMSEQSFGSQPVPMVRAEMAMMSKDASAPVPVAAGENQYQVSVSISWELDQ